FIAQSFSSHSGRGRSLALWGFSTVKRGSALRLLRARSASGGRTTNPSQQQRERIRTATENSGCVASRPGTGEPVSIPALRGTGGGDCRASQSPAESDCAGLRLNGNPADGSDGTARQWQATH